MSDPLATFDTDRAMHSLVIVGAGGFARELRGWLFDAFSPEEYSFKGFLGRPEEADSHSPPLADPREYVPAVNDRFLLAIGDLPSRREIVLSLLARGARFESFIHPTAVIASNAEIGPGAVIFPYAVVSNAARLGEFVHLSLYASVGHDAQVGDNCYLSPYATLNGASRIGHGVFLGSHASVGPRVCIGQRAKIAANSCALRDVADDSFVFGVPGTCTSQVPTDDEP